jgi:hypothetical protein
MEAGGMTEEHFMDLQGAALSSEDYPAAGVVVVREAVWKTVTTIMVEPDTANEARQLGALLIGAAERLDPTAVEVVRVTRLHKAAPELLAALEAFVRIEDLRTDGFSKVTTGQIVGCYDRARAAIANATEDTDPRTKRVTHCMEDGADV